jgi:hypothetical protein
MNFFKKAVPSPLAEPVHVLQPIHPFYPVGVEVANFIANDKTVVQLLATFAIGCAAVLGATWLLAGRLAPRLKATDKAAVLWFCLSKDNCRFCRVRKLTVEKLE